ncbi:Diaminopimelate epimerase [Candidatus Clavichlamydia salmonicola]|uniref:diaminopimelate epimerase n=1 Tax=Candidatus Clavichlamydia salmonicola TaxID=469812 RepID=UPI001890FBE9|nr:diaminopimelate epimerase [Candidatus Clavichlamydia salmonicola]MBF5051071.1 Diaminopimelate epimerase [Candidatus Clavichlamydia salmonicola]
MICHFQKNSDSASNCNLWKYSVSGSTFLVLNLRDIWLSTIFQPGQDGAKDVEGVIFYTDHFDGTCRMRFFNPDGSPAPVCGNGMMGLVYHLATTTERTSWIIHTESGHFKGWLENKIINLDLSEIVPNSIEEVHLEIGTKNYQCYKVLVGVPHLVIFIDELREIDLLVEGKAIRSHQKFDPEGTNVNFVKIENSSLISMRTYERGVEGETVACGTGALAAFCLAFRQGYVDSRVEVIPISGKKFTIGRHGSPARVILTGSVELLSVESLAQES